MSLIQCPNCGEKISSTAKKCVHCNTILESFENTTSENTNAVVLIKKRRKIKLT